MKQATYTLFDGSKLTVDYDETAPCRICGLPVDEASVGGTDVCSSCDCDVYRDDTSWDFRDATEPGRVKSKARDHLPTREDYERDNGRCHICGRRVDSKDWHLDHLIPLSCGGPHSRLNVSVSCPKCNLRRYNSSSAQLRIL